MKTKGPRSEFIDVSPEFAKLLLDGTRRTNRRLSENRVRDLAEEMARGAWKANNQGIAVDVDGNVIDGQHRLHAIIRSGVTVRCLVVWDVDPSAQSTIDRVRVRSISDDLRIGGDGYAHIKASRVSSICRVMDNRITVQSMSLFEEIYERFRVGVDWTVERLTAGKGVGQGSVAGALAIAYQAGFRDEMEDFVAGLKSGANLSDGSAALALRNFVISSSKGVDKRVVSVKALRAAQAHIDGQKIRASNLYDTESAVEFFLKRVPGVIRRDAA